MPLPPPSALLAAEDAAQHPAQNLAPQRRAHGAHGRLGHGLHQPVALAATRAGGAEAEPEATKDAPKTPRIPGAAKQEAEAGGGGIGGMVNEALFGRTGPRGGQYDGLVQTMAKTAARSVASGLGRQIVRGVLGSLLGGKR